MNLTLEHQIWTAAEKAVKASVKEVLSTKKRIMSEYANEALTDERLKEIIKDFINYDEGFRESLKEYCLEAVNNRMMKIVDGIKV